MNIMTNFQGAADFRQPISDWVWDEKYRYRKSDGSSDEHTIDDTHRRVVEGIYKHDPNPMQKEMALNLMQRQIWCPAGRIHAGAGTDSRVTLINCFVSPTIEDSMQTERDVHSKGIADALNVAMFTQQMGGGIGMAFHTLRPNGAIVKRTNSVSTGPLPFMNMWDAMCSTIKSSGSRRGAMMATMADWHPDVEAFITAKRQEGVFTNFNVSVLVSDALMRAVATDGLWELYFHIPRRDGNHVRVYEKNGMTRYVYKEVRARELWELITRNTYEYAEPGVIFIDRVNAWNNLYYCEDIQATNPCGEQPLPPDGDCNLGAINVARLVTDPFGDRPNFDFDTLEIATACGMRFLDNTLDVSHFPTEEQAEEAKAKRRTGLGITGLGNALQMLKVRYGSEQAVAVTGNIMRVIRDAAYRESIRLAQERGAFPAFDRDKYLKAKFIKTLPHELQRGIAEHGIRNAVLLTIAPTGTTSAYYNNVSSGIEPTFARQYTRKVREADGNLKTFGEVYDYGYLVYREVIGEPKEGEEFPDYMGTAQDLSVEDHVVMQAECQKYIDASISKTINCPESMSYEAFKNVYTRAYELGCKGCTTYRPSGVRGSVLSVEPDKKPEAQVPHIHVEPRPKELEGSTYKVRYPGVEQAFYVTINDYVKDGKKYPFEIFINSKSVKHQEWITALTRMLSAIFRRGGDVTFIIEELRQVYSPNGGAFIDKKYVPSLAALFGTVIENHFYKIGLFGGEVITGEVAEKIIKLFGNEDTADEISGESCPVCEAPTLIMQEGCAKCSSCGYSQCG